MNIVFINTCIIIVVRGRSQRNRGQMIYISKRSRGIGMPSPDAQVCPFILTLDVRNNNPKHIKFLPYSQKLISA